MCTCNELVSPRFGPGLRPPSRAGKGRGRHLEQARSHALGAVRVIARTARASHGPCARFERSCTRNELASPRFGPGLVDIGQPRMLEGAESCAVVSGASSEVASRRGVAPVHRRMQQCRRAVRVTRGGASRSPVCSSVVGVRCGRSWWVSRSTQDSTPETHRVASDAPAEELSDHTWSRRRPIDRWRVIP